MYRRTERPTKWFLDLLSHHLQLFSSDLYDQWLTTLVTRYHRQKTKLLATKILKLNFHNPLKRGKTKTLETLKTITDKNSKRIIKINTRRRIQCNVAKVDPPKNKRR